jgi:phosphohistidine phosphatase SixA
VKLRGAVTWWDSLPSSRRSPIAAQDAILPYVICAVFLFTANAVGAELSGQALVHALQHGGYVMVMRHASSPTQPPEARTADAENVRRERQLDERGRASATAMGEALRHLKVPIGQVFSSPTYRALETVRLGRFGKPQAVPELGDGGRSMQGASDAQAAWLRKIVTEFAKGTNTLVVTHQPNLARAFPQWAAGLGDGEALIFGPNGKGGATLVARVKIDEWPQLQP